MTDSIPDEGAGFVPPESAIVKVLRSELLAAQKRIRKILSRTEVHSDLYQIMDSLLGLLLQPIVLRDLDKYFLHKKSAEIATDDLLKQLLRLVEILQLIKKDVTSAPNEAHLVLGVLGIAASYAESLREYFSDGTNQTFTIIGDRAKGESSRVEGALLVEKLGKYEEAASTYEVKARRDTQRGRGERVDEVVTSLANVASNSSTDVLIESFHAYGLEQGKIAARFRFLSIGVVVAGIIAAFLWHDAKEIGDVVWRISLLAAVFGLAAYFARQAHQHRTLEVWGRTIVVQLRTFGAFIEPITSDSIRDELRRDFARRVFGQQPQLGGEPDQAINLGSLTDVASAALKPK